MKERKSFVYRLILLVILLVAIILLIIQNVPQVTGNSITGFATSGNTTSNVTITSYLSIAFCENLSQGIWFGEVSSLPVTNQNGTHNNDSNGASGGSSYCLNVSFDSNTNVDFCIKADGNMQTATLDAILLANETYNNATTTSSAVPAWDAETALTTTYVKSGDNVNKYNGTAGYGLNYYRFWLDIPSGQAAGTYNNTVLFKGVNTGNACGV